MSYYLQIAVLEIGLHFHRCVHHQLLLSVKTVCCDVLGKVPGICFRPLAAVLLVQVNFWNLFFSLDF
jgi:hypothetical protein